MRSNVTIVSPSKSNLFMMVVPMNPIPPVIRMPPFSLSVVGDEKGGDPRLT